MYKKNKNSFSAFTLIELLIVIAIIAIVSIAVVATLNPPEMLRSARDGSRLADMKTLNGVVGLYLNEFPNGGLGSNSTIYVSLPDKTLSGNATSTCTSLGLPTPPLGYSYQCTSPQSYRDVDGTGWMPVNLKQMAEGSPIGDLPIDPSNVSSTGLYYMYATDGASYVFTAIPESQKQKSALSKNPLIPNYPDVIAQGSDVTVNPLFSVTGLVGYWPFDEGTGTVANDASGNHNTGILSSAPAWVTGKVGGALNFNGSSNYVSVSTGPALTYNPITFATWVREAGSQYGTFMIGKATYGGFLRDTGGSQYEWDISAPEYNVFASIPSFNQWHFVVGTYDGNVQKLYVDGTLASSQSLSVTPQVTSDFGIGACIFCGPGQFTNGSLDDVRIYSRALSAAEIQALYNAEK